jgi:hypothetical protein
MAAVDYPRYADLKLRGAERMDLQQPTRKQKSPRMMWVALAALLAIIALLVWWLTR